MFIYMLEYLMQPFNYITNSQTGSTVSLSSDLSSRRTSLSSSRPEFRPIHSEIIRRNLVTDFMEASSLPGNVLTHRSREKTGKTFENSLESRSREEEEWSDWDMEKGGTKCKMNRDKLREDSDLMFCIDL